MNLLLALTFAASASLAQTPEQDIPTSVRVHIESDSPRVELFRITGQGVGTVMTSRGNGTMSFINLQRECVAPCDLRLRDPRSDFFVGGTGVTPSDRFSLLGQGEDVTLRVKAGSSLMRTLGWTAVILGVGSAIAGGSLLLVSNIISSPVFREERGLDTLSTYGAVSLIGGGVLLGAGIPLISFSGTDVEFLPTPSSGHPNGRIDL